MIAGADGDAAGVQEDVEGVQCGEAGCVCYGRAVQEGGEEGFEARGVGGGVARVDVCVCGLGVGLLGGGDEGGGGAGVGECCGGVDWGGDVWGGV